MFVSNRDIIKGPILNSEAAPLLRVAGGTASFPALDVV